MDINLGEALPEIPAYDRTKLLNSMNMKSAAIVALALAATAQATVQGFDISDSQPIVDFEAARDGGARFVIIKA